MLSGIGGNAIPAFAPQATSAAQNAGNLFKAIDSNGDGNISAAELSSFLGKLNGNGATQSAAAPGSSVSGTSVSSLIDQLRNQLATGAAVSAGNKAGAAASAAVSTSASAASTAGNASAQHNPPASSAVHHHHHHHGGGAGNGSSIAPQLVQQYQQSGTSSGVNAGSGLSAIA